MATQWETFPIKFEGGLITNKGRIEQGVETPGSATILQNFEADIRGGYTKILGYKKFSTTAVPNTGLVKGVVAVDHSKILAFRNDKVYVSTGTSWTDILTIPITTYNKVAYESYNFGSGKKFVVTDGVNMPAFYDVTAGTMAYGVGFPTDVQGAVFVKNFKNHLFYSKGTNLVFTAPYDDADFLPANGGGVINIGDDITGLILFREQLFIFCANKIFRLSGNTAADFAVAPVTTNTGCLFGHTIQEVGGDIMYLSRDGVRYLSASERDNDFGLTRASEKIQSEFAEISATSPVFSSITIASKNQYRLFVYEETVSRANAKGFIAVKFSNQSVDSISWSTIKGMKVYATTEFSNEIGESFFFCGDTDYVYTMESGFSFDGENISAIFETPYTPINDPRIRKTLYKHTLYTRARSPVDLELRLYFDYDTLSTTTPPPITISQISVQSIYGDPLTIYGTSFYASGAEVQYYNNLVGSGFVVALRYTNNSTQPSFNLNFAVLEYRTNDRR